MTNNEKEALLTYLESQLMALCRKIEQQMPNPDAVGFLYDEAYALVHDIEDTISTSMLIQETERRVLTKKTKSQ